MLSTCRGVLPFPLVPFDYVSSFTAPPSPQFCLFRLPSLRQIGLYRLGEPVSRQVCSLKISSSSQLFVLLLFKNCLPESLLLLLTFRHRNLFPSGRECPPSFLTTDLSLRELRGQDPFSPSYHSFFYVFPSSRLPFETMFLLLLRFSTRIRLFFLPPFPLMYRPLPSLLPQHFVPSFPLLFLFRNWFLGGPFNLVRFLLFFRFLAVSFLSSLCVERGGEPNFSLTPNSRLCWPSCWRYFP